MLKETAVYDEYVRWCERREKKKSLLLDFSSSSVLVALSA
jgi:hypothetical protein